MNMISNLRRKFTSGNSVPVTRATITAEEWWQQNMEAQPLALRLANDERNEHEERDDDH